MGFMTATYDYHRASATPGSPGRLSPVALGHSVELSGKGRFEDVFRPSASGEGIHEITDPRLQKYIECITTGKGAYEVLGGEWRGEGGYARSEGRAVNYHALSGWSSQHVRVDVNKHTVQVTSEVLGEGPKETRRDGTEWITAEYDPLSFKVKPETVKENVAVKYYTGVTWVRHNKRI